jgi:O-antigen/teichoic acid export membrane protein
LLEIHGLKGLALGLLIQNLITLIFSSFFLKSLIKGLNLLFIRFDKEIFKEIFNYGYKFQLISILQMLMDPLTKFLLKSYGGLASVGYFELIFKFLFHARQLIVVATNTVIPTVASLQEQINNNIKEKFNIIFSLNFIFSIIILTLTFSLLPIFIAFVNIEMDEQVSLYSSLIYFGLLFNLFSVAPFVFNLGLGRLNMNLLSISLMAILNLTLSLFFAFFYQGTGVIMGWMSSQIISNILLFLLFIRSQNISPRNIISKSDIFLVFTIIASLIALYIFNSKFNSFNLFITLLINVMIPLGLMSIPILKNKKYQFVKKYVRKKINI